ncbi:MAG: ParB/RepB/Spo0J family partition protein [Deltaproteobacteria bacterium]|nr:ParB/RepB/Spo0J family partition protein [Deltaproteobacteria bacterium]
MHDEQPTSVTETKAKKTSAIPKPPPLPREEKAPSLAGEFRYAKLSQLRQDPENLRKAYDDIDELAAALREDGGILNPLVVRPEGDGFLIIAGNRRYLAAMKIALDEVPIRVVNVTDEEKDALQISENINRSDVSAIELAHRLKRMMDRYPKEDATRVDKVAKRLSRTPNLVRQYLALLKLDPRVVKALERNRLGISQAKEVVKLARAEMVPEALELAATMKSAPSKSAAGADQPVKPEGAASRRVFDKRGDCFAMRVIFTSMNEAREAAFRADLEKVIAVHGVGQ